MPGDYSRNTFDRKKHYSAVLKQQGRVEVDADDNEQLAIQHYRIETEAIDVIGQSGVPKKNDGFKIGIASGGRDLTISPGRYYVEGLLCELDQPANYSSQPYHPNPKFTSLNSSTSPPSLQVDLPGDGSYLVFLDAWQREITALDDEGIREVALGGPDTATRLQNVWQVRLMEFDRSDAVVEANCKSPVREFDRLTSPSSGKLKARTQPPEAEQSACLLPPGTGYNRLENQLYRVEVHTGGPLTAATFKWSRDNASVETTITKIVGSVLTVADLGKDEILNFAPGQWVEIVDDESTLKADPHPLAQIDNIGPGPNEVTLTTSADVFANSPGLKLRRWDQSETNANTAGLTANSPNWINLEAGIEVSFSDGEYRAGDYWLIPARAATGAIEWPVDPVSGPIGQSPKGIQHHYCRLAVIKLAAGALEVIDCRKPFPSLTEICAVDVCFDNKTCDFEGAKTVQDALDMLCRRREAGQCTFVVSPGQNVQAVFDAIPANGDAEICFQVGLYDLPKTINVEGKGNLKISGVGFGTRLVAAQAEAAVKFEKCASVLIRDIFAETGSTQLPERDSGLGGALTFLNCPLVNVESVGLKCASAPAPRATCVTVRNDTAFGSARIQHCFLQPGHQQSGILLVNVARSHVEDNVIRVSQTGRLRRDQLVGDLTVVASLRALLIPEVRVGAPTEGQGRGNVTFKAGDQEINLRVKRSLKGAWSALLAANPPASVDTPGALLAHVERLADRIVVDEEFSNRNRPFGDMLASVFQQAPNVGSQGITVGGDAAGEVRIINNTIENVLQGIHVGLSRGDDRIPHAARVVTIGGNTILILLGPLAIKQDRHAIFVGNCESLLIENNNARLSRLPEAQNLPVDGIRVWGKLGDRALITQNHIASADGNTKNSFNISISFNPLERRLGQLWLANFNVAGKVVATNDALENNNFLS